ncbi:MAG: CBS domain-containing protein [Erysipelotrichales bacterium]|nr:MAG: CBS domain-containing protein [Erysipelotrichales bacterium]
MTEDHNHSERFLAAFSLLEGEMTRRIRSDRYISYNEMIHRMSKLDHNYARYVRLLEEFGDLRNAIVHERIDGEVVAEPHLKLVLEIEQVALLLTQPPKAKDFFLREVKLCYIDELLGDVMIRMMKDHFSKLPTYDRQHKFIGLLTTDAITYYLASHISDVQQCIPKVTVGEVFASDDKSREVCFMTLETSLMDIVAEFEKTLTLGKKLNAVMLTQNGSRDQKPLGIVTLSDLPRIYEKINKNLL